MAFVYPVIHYLNKFQAIEQAKIAYYAGASGVFLISHDGKDNELVPVAKEIKILFPSFKVGLNYLKLGVLQSFNDAKENDLDMIWGDNCGVSSKGLNNIGKELEFKAKNNKVKIFASVAFKYQPEENNPELAALNAKLAGFIPTTSGSATGISPEIEKIKNMSKSTSGLLGVASGMTEENIRDYRSYLSDILISTGVSKDFHHLDENALERFIDLVNDIK